MINQLIIVGILITIFDIDLKSFIITFFSLKDHINMEFLIVEVLTDGKGSLISLHCSQTNCGVKEEEPY